MTEDKTEIMLANLFIVTRGTFRQVPTRLIYLSFVECAYSGLHDIFFIILEV